jgi:hypothetical protein
MTWQPRKTTILKRIPGKNGENWSNNQADHLSHVKSQSRSRQYRPILRLEHQSHGVYLMLSMATIQSLWR